MQNDLLNIKHWPGISPDDFIPPENAVDNIWISVMSSITISPLQFYTMDKQQSPDDSIYYVCSYIHRIAYVFHSAVYSDFHGWHIETLVQIVRDGNRSKKKYKSTHMSLFQANAKDSVRFIERMLGHKL